MKLERKYFEIDSKEVNEQGEFTGIASFYGNVDLGMDIVEKGAFTNWLNTKQKVVMLWQHEVKTPIGVFSVSNSEVGLEVIGKLNLDVEKGREAFALLKQGALDGLSIGYIIKDFAFENGVRLLKELDLKEISLVTFPMNELATVAPESVKSDGCDDDSELGRILETIKKHLQETILQKKLEEISTYIKTKN